MEEVWRRFLKSNKTAIHVRNASTRYEINRSCVQGRLFLVKCA